MKSKLTYNISLIAFFTTLLVISSWFTIPFVIPFTLQTLVIFILILVLDLKKSLLILLIYCLLGIIGIPVFSSFQSGLGVFLGPTGGFLIGFVPMIIVSNILLKIICNKRNGNLDNKTNFIMSFLALFIGLLCCYTIATIWYGLVYDTTTSSLNIIIAIILPFILPDIIKIIIAIIIAKKFISIKN